WGSGILARLMTRAPWIVWLGGGVLGYVAGEMALRDRIVQGWLGARVAAALERPVPLVLGVALTVLGWWFGRAARRPGGGCRRMRLPAIIILILALPGLPGASALS